MPTGLVGDAGNAADSTGYGSVNYQYRIGQYEVSLTQYTAFLNAVAATDSYGLYNSIMASNLDIAGISRSGSSGSYNYSVIGSGNRPVTYVSWFDAARFANWMNNGATSAASTETGAYTLNGATSGVGFTKNPGATWWIPSEDEWYKAAYYKGGGTNAGYWQYAMQTNIIAGNTIGVAQSANYYDGNYAKDQNSLPSSLTDGGAYGANSASFYGTYDQSGNIWEWNDAVIVGERGLRGGSWGDTASYLQSSFQTRFYPSFESDNIGFRIANIADSSAVPEPGQIAASGVLLIGGGLYWLMRRRKVKAVA
jgi:formylglycine-generating enzyme required for sulfatase activity